MLVAIIITVVIELSNKQLQFIEWLFLYLLF